MLSTRSLFVLFRALDSTCMKIRFASKNLAFPVLANALFSSLGAASFAEGVSAQDLADVEKLKASIHSYKLQIGNLNGKITAMKDAYYKLPEVVEHERICGLLHDESLTYQNQHAQLKDAHNLAKQKMYELDALLIAKRNELPAYKASIEQADLDEDQIASLYYELAILNLELTSPHSPVGRMLAKDPDLKLIEGGKTPELLKRAETNGFFSLKYTEAYRLKLESIPRVKELNERVLKLKERIIEVSEGVGLRKHEHWMMREQIRKGPDPEVIAMRKEYLNARAASNKIMSGQDIQSRINERNTCRTQIEQRILNISLEDPDFQALLTEREALQATLRDLQRALAAHPAAAASTRASDVNSGNNP